MEKLRDSLRAMPAEGFKISAEDSFLDMRLGTVRGRSFAGQIVQENETLHYASVFARRKYLYN